MWKLNTYRIESKVNEENAAHNHQKTVGNFFVHVLCYGQSIREQNHWGYRKADQNDGLDDANHQQAFAPIRKTFPLK